MGAREAPGKRQMRAEGRHRIPPRPAPHPRLTGTLRTAPRPRRSQSRAPSRSGHHLGVATGWSAACEPHERCPGAGASPGFPRGPRLRHCVSAHTNVDCVLRVQEVARSEASRLTLARRGALRHQRRTRGSRRLGCGDAHCRQLLLCSLLCRLRSEGAAGRAPRVDGVGRLPLWLDAEGRDEANQSGTHTHPRPDQARGTPEKCFRPVLNAESGED